MAQEIQQQQISAISITPKTIEINSDKISTKNENGLLNIKTPENFTGILTYKVSGEGKINENCLLTVSKNSELTLFEDREGNLEGEAKIKIILEENSKLDLIEIQNLSYNSKLNINKEVYCNKNSNLTREVICLGSNEIKVDCNIYLDQESNAKDSEVFFGNKEQKFELNTNLIHKGPKSNGNVQIRGVLKDKSYCYSHGILKINKEAQQTNTFLSEHVLLLSKESKAQAIPALEIEANDVQAQHSASVTQIDNDQLFYILSRGLEEKEARKMIVQGFLSSVLSQASQNMQVRWLSLFEEKWNK
ncbi:MAG: SufD family Fe-S cluster assembly protein [Candidatus Woesearchaeota archaeon]|nr:MAG: SufD family Fe-S cluster assembly protein [Candidatus Woesearchaeota archaeon]